VGFCCWGGWFSFPQGERRDERNEPLLASIFSQEMLLSEQDELLMKQFGEHLRTSLKPAGDLEHILVDRI
jgi:hypothetical protein